MLTTTPTADVALDAPETAAPRKRRHASRGRFDRSSVGVAILVAFAGAGLYYMHWRTADGAALVASAADGTAGVASLLAGGQQDLAKLARSIRETRAVVDRFATRDAGTRLAALRAGGPDPFDFASLEPKADAAQKVHPGVGSREQHRAHALAAARRLQLQSIMYGTSRRSCLVDGKLYFEGQSVGEFVVAQITRDAVLVQSGESRFELRLRK